MSEGHRRPPDTHSSGPSAFDGSRESHGQAPGSNAREEAPAEGPFSRLDGMDGVELGNTVRVRGGGAPLSPSARPKEKIFHAAKKWGRVAAVAAAVYGVNQARQDVTGLAPKVIEHFDPTGTMADKIFEWLKMHNKKVQDGTADIGDIFKSEYLLDEVVARGLGLPPSQLTPAQWVEVRDDLARRYGEWRFEIRKGQTQEHQDGGATADEDDTEAAPDAGGPALEAIVKKTPRRGAGRSAEEAAPPAATSPTGGSEEAPASKTTAGETKEPAKEGEPVTAEDNAMRAVLVEANKKYGAGNFEGACHAYKEVSMQLGIVTPSGGVRAIPATEQTPYMEKKVKPGLIKMRSLCGVKNFPY